MTYLVCYSTPLMTAVLHVLYLQTVFIFHDDIKDIVNLWKFQLILTSSLLLAIVQITMLTNCRVKGKVLYWLWPDYQIN